MKGRLHAAHISAVVDASKMTYVDVDTDVYDKCNSGGGCSPNVCAPYNTPEESRSSNYRWSCKRDILDSSDENYRCCVMYYFEDAQDIVDLQIAFDQGYKIP